MKTEILSGLMISFLGTSLDAACVFFMTILMKHTETMAACALQPGITASVSTDAFHGEEREEIYMTSKEYKKLPFEKRGFCRLHCVARKIK